MRANYHTHTWRCNHAVGSEEDYVIHAIEQGFDILGFSDHTPQFFRDGYRSGIRMDPEELPNYCRVIRELLRGRSLPGVPASAQVSYHG